MIRHGSSFFISLTFHGLILLLLFFTWKNIPVFEKKEPLLYVQLCTLVHETRPQAVKQELKSAPLIQEAPVEKMKETAKQIPVVKEKKVREEKITKIEKKEQPKKVENVKSENVKVKTEEIKIIEDAKVLRVAESNQTIVSQKQIQAPVQEKPVAQKVSPEIKYIDEHITEITKLLEDNLYYPRAARKRGIVGNVIVKFKLSQDGSASFIKVVASKDEILSRAAIKTIEDLSGKFPKPNEDIVIKVPIDYDLK